jgi:hypothetical protein
MAVASGPVNMAPAPEVTAAQILTASAPMWFAIIPSHPCIPCGLTDACEEISETLLPYA